MSTENTPLSEQESINLEIGEADALLDRGVEFKVRKRKFVIHKPYAGTLDYVAKLSLEMALDESVLQGEQATQGANEIVSKSVKNYALLVAIVVLNNKWKIRLFGKTLANWFYWNMKAADMKALATIILEDSSIVDFIISIKLIAGMKRTTKPNLIEQKEQA